MEEILTVGNRTAYPGTEKSRRQPFLLTQRMESKGYNTVDIPNPNPKWKSMGFKSKDEVRSFQTKNKM